MTSPGNCANPQLEIHTVSNERLTKEEREAISAEFPADQEEELTDEVQEELCV